VEPPAPGPGQASSVSSRPNILWIVSEDNGPQLGAYGDTYAKTPNLDQLAARGYRYRVAWSNGPVCGAARTGLITGVYPESTGGEHMRSLVRLPSFIQMYPALLHAAGYYVTNNSKTDYNYPGGDSDTGGGGPAASGVAAAGIGGGLARDNSLSGWDESSSHAHWKNRKPGQPFFAIFNIMDSHESRIRMRPHTWVHDIARTPVPPYMPDTKETREDWAQFYDQMTVTDGIAGERLTELAAAGLADDTIVMYYGDHGAGMPRSKRFVYNSGLQVPLIVYIPPNFRNLGPPEASRPGGESTRLVSFVDLAPTLVSLAGVKPPDWMQGHAFLGSYMTPAPDYLFGFRGRMDERYDMARAVRDQRYIYIRQYMPHRPYGQYVAYMFGTPMTAVWKRMYDAGELRPPQTYFWEEKPGEELYDLQNDPWEVKNLADSASLRSVLDRLRKALDEHERAVRDVGFLPEYELHRDDPTGNPYERGHDPKRYNFEKIYATAQAATDRNVPAATLQKSLTDGDPIVRYWAAMGMVIRGRTAVMAAVADLQNLLADAEPGPRIEAAEALGRFGPPALRARAVEVLMQAADATKSGGFVSHLALYTLNQFTDLTEEERTRVQSIPTADPPNELHRGGNYGNTIKTAIMNNVR
jgi:uncharacterized sulfatase